LTLQSAAIGLMIDNILQYLFWYFIFFCIIRMW
jgi:hypothetical protein